MAISATIEKGAHEVLNAGLGLFKTVEERVEAIRADVERGFRELINRGAADNGDTVVAIRRQLDMGLAAVKDLQEKVQSKFASSN